MKKTVLVTTLALALMLTACGTQQAAVSTAPSDEASQSAETTAPELVGLANPMVPSTGEGLYEAGLPLTLPEAAKAESYYIIAETTGHVAFTMDGHGYYLRCSKTTEDISGIYAEVSKVITEDDITVEMMEGCCARAYWFSGDMQFCLGCQDVTEESEFISAAKTVAKGNR